MNESQTDAGTGREWPEPGGPSAGLPGPLRIVHFWFGLHDEVGPRAYAATGFGLTTIKYLFELTLIGAVTGRFYSPLRFLSPLLVDRTADLRDAPGWVEWTIFVFTLISAWIAVSMSVRRSANAGWSPWTGMLVLVPYVNLVVMIVLCVVPTSRHRVAFRVARDELAVPNALWAAARGAFLGVVVGAVMMAVAVYGLDTYGAALFVGTPLLMGALAGYFYNRPYPRSLAGSMATGALSTIVALALLLVFALEGAICLGMAAPLLVPLGFVGGAIGKAIAGADRAGAKGGFVAVVALPLLAVAESAGMPQQEYVVLTTVEIKAPPATVWQWVVAFPELSEPTEWYFRVGIASPQRARIFGGGVGATRYCEFTTGSFVEPITAWDEPRRLAFDVAAQPAPLFELSPYREVHPPHLDRALRSRRGEFRLVELPGGGTRLEGRTWYTLDMQPAAYWKPWSDFFIHRIHARVLEHIKRVSERVRDDSSKSRRLAPSGKLRAARAGCARPRRRAFDFSLRTPV